MNHKPKSNINPILCIAFFLLAITSGWALKNVNSQAQFSLIAYSLLLLHSLLGVLAYTHPNSSLSLRNLTLFVSLNAQLILLPLVLTDAYYIVHSHFSIWWLYTIIGLAAIAFVGQFVTRYKVDILTAGVSVLFNVVFVGWIALKFGECYWSAGMISLVLLNHFLLINQLASFYDISRLEIATTCICFLVLFSMNSINEISSVPGVLLKKT